MGLLLVGAAMFPTEAQPAITQPVVAPSAGVTSGYGKYLASISGCTVCHGADLGGGKAGLGPPPGPNLTALLPNWTDAQFITTIRTGVNPTGHQLSDTMPWKDYNAMFVDDELKAMHAYLHGLTPVQR